VRAGEVVSRPCLRLRKADRLPARSPRIADPGSPSLAGFVEQPVTGFAEKKGNHS